MKLYVRIIGILLLIAVNPLQAQGQKWETQITNTKQVLRSICFVDTLNGWACGDSSTVVRTTNGGKTWTSTTASIGKDYLLSIQFTTKTKGHAVGNNGALLKTDDGGNSWLQYKEKFEINFRDLFFLDENNGWAVGRFDGPSYGRGLIIHTTDGGVNWTKQLEVYATQLSQLRLFSSIKMRDFDLGWAIASDYIDNYSVTYIYKTEDGGQHWNVQSTLPFPSLKIKIANKDTLWCGASALSSFSVSHNAGKSWIIDKQSNSKLSYVMTPMNGLKGWSSYRDNSTQTPLYRILYTSDGGNSWENEVDVNFIITDMYYKYGTLWLVGTDGTVMKKRFVPTDINDSPVPTDITLSQNFPNPFNPSTTIEYAIPQAEYVTLKVFDVLGREVATLVDEFKQPGAYKANFNASGLVSGVYFYLMQAGNFGETRKMIFLK